MIQTVDPSTFRNWLPSKLIEKENQLWLEWIYLGDVPFTKPFFDETLIECRQQNSISQIHSEKRITPLEFLIAVANTIECITPHLFIFHTSRCGSTLASQILAIDNSNIVVPEYHIIDAILRLNEKKKVVKELVRQELLKSILTISGQKRTPEQQRLIIKLDCWHFNFYTEIRNLFPDAKFAIMFRDPGSIIQSAIKKPGIQFIPDIVPPSNYQLTVPKNSSYLLVDYSNLILEAMYRIIEEITIRSDDILLLNYSTAMKNNLIQLFALLEMPLNFIDDETVTLRMNCHSKKPNECFTPENTAHYELVTGSTREAYHRLLQFI